jgi:zinc protease
MYVAHPYGRQATAESVAALERTNVLAFHAAHYTAPRATLAIVGDLSRAQAEAVAEDLTAALPASPGMTTIAVPELPSSSEQRIAHPALQAHLLLGLPAVKRGDPDFFPLLVGNYTLGGGGFVSRLMKVVRDQRGMAYSVHSYFQPLAQLGPFQIGLQTKKEQAQDALRLTREVLASFLAQGPSREELLAAKQNLIGSFPLRLDSNSEILGSVAVIGFYGLPLDYLDRYPDNIEKVTLADIKAAFARRVRPAHLATVIVAGD